MSRLFVPPKVARELLAERQKYVADLDAACHVDQVCKDWTRELRRLDPLLRMVRAPEYPVVGTPLLPGHYHMIRDNPGAPPSVTPVRGPNGEVDPPGSLLERLKSMDLQDARVVAAREREQREVQASHDRDVQRHREDRDQNILEKWLAVSRTQISMNDSVPWAQNHQGTKRRGPRGGGGTEPDPSS